MKQLKTHLKLKGRPLCGVKRNKHPLKFTASQDQLTCERCKKAVER
jgi:hypothetical protein